MAAVTGRELARFRKLSRRHARAVGQLHAAQLEVSKTLGAMARELDESAELEGIPVRVTPRAEAAVQLLGEAYSAVLEAFDQDAGGR